MAVEQPLGTDYLNSPSHSKLHRTIASDINASDEALTVDAAGNVVVAETLQSKMNKQANVWHSYGGF